MHLLHALTQLLGLGHSTPLEHSGLPTQAQNDAAQPAQVWQGSPRKLVAQGGATQFVGRNLGNPGNTQPAPQNPNLNQGGRYNPGYTPLQNGGQVPPQQNAAGGNFQLPPVKTTYDYPIPSVLPRLAPPQLPHLQPLDFQQLPYLPRLTRGQ